MKSLMFGILCLACLCAGCEKGPEANLQPGNALKEISLDKSKSLIPLSLLTKEANAIFVNAQGTEKLMHLDWKEGVRNQSYQGFHYDAQYLEIKYTDRDDPSYAPVITARAEYSDLKNYDETVWVIISNLNDDSYTPTLILCPELQCPYLKRSFEKMELCSHSFDQVYASCSPPAQFHSFADVYYTTDKGIIAFQGQNGEMWVLDRFEE